MPSPEPRLVDMAAGRSLSCPEAEPLRPSAAFCSGGQPPVAVGPGRPVALPRHVPERARDVNEFPIQESKVQRPPLRDTTLRRDRLLDWLHTKVHHRVVFVTAEAGYGKTTLLSDFARRTRLRTLWYRLDDEDRDWISLLNYLVAAGRQVEPAFAPTTASMLRELAAGGASREVIVETFARELAIFGTAGAVLILDDYHLVDDVPDVRDVMKEIVSRAPERLTFVFLSRRRPTIPLARMRALGELVELREEDLRFDAAETERLFREAYGTPLEPDVLVDLTQRTEGWAASLQLVHAAIADRPRAEIRSFVRNLTGANAELHDYLAEEVVGVLDEELQDFLMRVSILQDVTDELAGLVTGLDESRVGRLLSQSERLGLLPPRSSSRRDGRSFHPLVRDFLEHRLVREAGSAATCELHLKVARHADGWNWRLAAHHFAAGTQTVQIHRVLTENVRAIFGAGDFGLAETYIERFPSDLPVPAFDMIRSRMDLRRHNLPSARARAQTALDAYPSASQDPVGHLAIANLMGIEFSLGAMENAVRLAERLLSLNPEEPLRAIAAATLSALSSSASGNLNDYAALLRAMSEDQLRLGYARYYGITRMNLAIVNRARARASEALEDAEKAIEALSASSAGYELPGAHAARAWALAHLGHWQESLAELEVALSTDHALARDEVLQEAADIHCWYGDADVSQRLLDDLWPRVPENDLARVSAAQNLVRLRRLDDAARLLAESPPNCLTGESGHHARRLTVIAQLALLRDDPRAPEQIDEALRLSEAQAATFWLGANQILAGASGSVEALNNAVHSVGSSNPALLSVVADFISPRLGDLGSEPLALVGNEARMRPVRWRPPLRMASTSSDRRTRFSAAQLLDVVGSREDIPRLRAIARDLRGRTGDGELGKRLARALAPRVFVEDQGRVAIWIGDQLVPGSEVRRKVLALLCYLLTRGDLSATRDQVLDALWPDFEPDVAANSLNQTVYFLRRVFESEYEDDLSPGYVHHNSELVWLDADLVGSRSRRCRDLVRRRGADTAPAEAEELIDEYRDRFALDFI